MNKTKPATKKEIWVRTGKTTQKTSFNKRGVITLAEEKSGNKYRLVPIGYISVTPPQKD